MFIHVDVFFLFCTNPHSQLKVTNIILVILLMVRYLSLVPADGSVGVDCLPCVPDDGSMYEVLGSQ